MKCFAFSRQKIVLYILLPQGVTIERITTQIKQLKQIMAIIEEEYRIFIYILII